MALLDTAPRSADVKAMEEAQVVEILRADLIRLMERRPRLGTLVMRHLATGLAEKLRNIDSRYADSGDWRPDA